MVKKGGETFDEEAVKTSLSEWIMTRCTGASVFWEKNDASDTPYQAFNYSGDSGRPDLMVVGESRNIILEVKDGTSSNKIYDSVSQLHRYWCEAEFGDAVAVVDGEEYAIDSFLIASQFTPKGRLFKKEREGKYRETFDPKAESYNLGSRPQFEWTRTEAIPRIQWRYAWREAEDRGKEKAAIETGLGCLLSSKLDQSPNQGSLSDYAGSSSEVPDSIPKSLEYTGENGSVWTEV